MLDQVGVAVGHPAQSLVLCVCVTCAVALTRVHFLFFFCGCGLRPVRQSHTSHRRMMVVCVFFWDQEI